MTGKNGNHILAGVTLILVLVLSSSSSPCIAAIDQNFPNVWHVRVDGDDSYEGHSYQTGLATVMTAVAAASDGDTIYIWPGDYNETVDLDAHNKALTLIGISRSASKITHGKNAAGIKLEDGCVIKNLSVILTGPPGNGILTQAIIGLNKRNCIVEDCDISGTYDGLYLGGAVKPIIKNCRISSGFDALFLAGATDFLVDNCTLEVSNSYSTETPMRALIFFDNSRGVCRNICISVNRKDAGVASVRATGIEYCGGTSMMVVVENFTVNVTAGANVAGDAYGVYSSQIGRTTGGKIILSNGIISAVTSGSGKSMDICNLSSTGTIAAQNIIYSSDSGAITQGGSGFGEAITRYADPNGFMSKMTKYLIILSGYNKAPNIVPSIGN
jgi:parallel beta-helix repeat protein